MEFVEDRFEALVSLLAAATPSQWCIAFFTLSAGVLSVPLVALPQSLHRLMLNYGARYSELGKEKKEDGDGTAAAAGAATGGRLQELVEKLTAWTQVPHSWFAAFYGTSLACCFFWLQQYLTNGSVLHSIATRQANASSTAMSMNQVALVWILMVLQAGRRLYEHAFVIKQKSKSTMWVVHWLLGVAYYMFLSLSLWIEGSDAILTEPLTTPSVPSLRTLLGVTGFLFAWVNQYKCHKHLAGLKKYSLPNEGMFRKLVTPHYTCECLLYLSLAFVAAPPGKMWNATLLGNLFFVVFNLGVTSSSTRKWYIEKFGSGPLADKWNMIPFVY